VGQCRGHLGDAEAEAVVHDDDDDGGNQKTTETADAQTEVPAVEVARDDRGDAQRPERPEGGMPLQASLGEIPLSCFLVSNRPDFAAFLSQGNFPLSELPMASQLSEVV